MSLNSFVKVHRIWNGFKVKQLILVDFCFCFLKEDKSEKG